MEKNLNKYVTLEEAAKQTYLSADMILRLATFHRMSYFSDRGVIKVYPGDIQEAINEMIGMDEKKIQQRIKSREKARELFSPETQTTPPTSETRPETAPDNGDQANS